MEKKKDTFWKPDFLQHLTQEYIKAPDQRNLTLLLACLRDCYVWVPEKTDILQQEEEVFFPVFSSAEVMGDEYASQFGKAEKHFLEAIELVKATEGVDSMVLDPFTGGFVLDKELIDFISKMPSAFEPQKQD